MGLRSVMAVVGPRDDGREHFALGSRERRLAEHDVAIERNPGLQHLRVLTLHLEDIEDLARALEGCVVDALEQPIGFRFGEYFDPGHARLFYFGKLPFTCSSLPASPGNPL